MTKQTTIQLKLLPTKEQQQLIQKSMNEYIATVNTIVADFRVQEKIDKRTSKNVTANLPSCLKNQAIKDAKSIFKKYKKACGEADKWNKKHPDEAKKATCPMLRKLTSIWNNQNYSVNETTIGFPVVKNGKSTKIYIRTLISTVVLWA